jgi:lysophospholipase L1-like esterase
VTRTRRFLALGDSYTIGEGVAASARWPVQLAIALGHDGLAVEEPRMVARTGWTTDELLAAIDLADPPIDHNYDLVTLLIGVNDQYRGRGVDAFRAGFERLLERVAAFAGAPARTVAVSIPDWAVTPFARNDPRGAPAITREIEQFNTAARALSESLGAAFVDITDISRGAADNLELLAADALHPSAAMYARWVPVILPAAAKALRA